MKTLQTLALLLMVSLLTSCGGGGSPYVATTDTDCTLDLQYANGASSGITIAESSDWAPLNTELSRPLSGCKIERLQTMTLGLCIRHDTSGDLQASVTGPQNTSSGVFSLASKSGSADSACSRLDVSARAFTLSLSVAPFAGLTTLDGPWRVQVRDGRTGFGSGTLIGWSLTFEGLKW